LSQSHRCRRGWNKSSVDGNAEVAWLVPLRFPRALPTDSTFIANYQYRQIQRMFEGLLAPE